MKRMMSIMLVIGMMMCFGGCSNASSDSMADIYYDNEKLGSYYSSYQMSDFTQEVDGNRISGIYKNLNGMVMLWNYEVEEDIALDVNYSMKVSQGKVKLVIVDPDGNVVTIAELSNGVTGDMMKTQSFSLHEGLYRVKLVGTENATVDFELEIAGGDFYGV